MQFFATAFPIPLFQSLTSDDVHIMPAFLAKLAVPDSPTSDASLHQKIVKKFFGSVYWMRRVQNIISFGNYDPTGIFISGQLFFFKPSSPDEDVILVGVKKVPKLSAKTGPRSDKFQSSELQSEFLP